MIAVDLSDTIGLGGSILFIVAFLYANRVPVIDKLLFNALNLAGAIMLLISLYSKFNLAAFALEAIWGMIASFGLVKALRTRS